MTTKIHPRAGEIVTLDNGHTGKVLANGVVYDQVDKKFAGPVDENGLTTAIRTQTQANAMASLRWQAVRDQAEAAAIEAASEHDPNIAQIPGGWIRPIIKGRYAAAVDAKNSRGVESAQFILKAAGYEQNAGQNAPVAGTIDGLTRFVEALERFMHGEVVDGRVIDG